MNRSTGENNFANKALVVGRAKSREKPLDYTEARREAADQHFDGNSNFMIHGTMEVSNSEVGFFGGLSDISGSDFDSNWND